jgi:hypothetical protein
MATDAPVTSRGEIHLFATARPRRGLFRYLPPATHAELGLGLALIVLSLLGAAYVIKCRSEALTLEHDSVTVEGKVLHLKTTRGKGGWGFRVEYEYPAPPETESQVFRNETRLPKEHFGLLKEGGPIAVKVSRTDPANHQVVGEHPRAFSNKVAMPFALGLLALLALVGGINLWWWWVSRRNPRTAQIVVMYAVSGRVTG